MFQFTRNNQNFKCSPIILEGFEGDSDNDSGFVCTNTKENNIEGFESGNKPDTYLPLLENANDMGEKRQNSKVNGQTRFDNIGGKKAAIFNNRMDTFVQVDNKTNGTFTVMFWIYRIDGGGYTAVSITDGNNPLLQFDTSSDRQIAFSALPNPWVHDGWSRAVVPPGSWYHVAYVCSGNEASLYINGNKDNSFRGSGPMNSASRPFWYIGRSGDSGRAFHGAIRQFAVWNSVVDDNTIRSFMRMTENDTKPEPKVFNKIECPSGQIQAGFSCYPPFLINK
jgi:hypothetical protein